MTTKIYDTHILKNRKWKMLRNLSLRHVRYSILLKPICVLYSSGRLPIAISSEFDISTRVTLARVCCWVIKYITRIMLMLSLSIPVHFTHIFQAIIWVPQMPLVKVWGIWVNPSTLPEYSISWQYNRKETSTMTYCAYLLKHTISDFLSLTPNTYTLVKETFPCFRHILVAWETQRWNLLPQVWMKKTEKLRWYAFNLPWDISLPVSTPEERMLYISHIASWR